MFSLSQEVNCFETFLGDPNLCTWHLVEAATAQADCKR